jgi:nitroreductase
MGFLDKLHWRYAVKKFNGGKVSEENLAQIVEAIRLAPSSTGTQPYHIVVVSDQMLREKLFEYAKTNPKILDCSHLFIFCARTDYPKRVADFIEVVKETRDQTDEEVKGYRESLEKGVQEKIDSGKLLEWAGKQAYLALGFGIAAAAELGIDSGPMEGFDKDGFKEVLGLPEYMYPEVLMAVGFRDKEDQNQPEFRKKVRFPKDTLFDFR